MLCFLYEFAFTYTLTKDQRWWCVRLFVLFLETTQEAKWRGVTAPPHAHWWQCCACTVISYYIIFRGCLHNPEIATLTFLLMWFVLYSTWETWSQLKLINSVVENDFFSLSREDAGSIRHNTNHNGSLLTMSHSLMCVCEIIPPCSR